MDGPPFQTDSANSAGRAWPNWVLECVLLRLGRKAIVCAEAIYVPIALEDHAPVRLAKPRRRFRQRVEHGLQIERRPADDLEHVGGRGLLLQRFAKLAKK